MVKWRNFNRKDGKLTNKTNDAIDVDTLICSPMKHEDPIWIDNGFIKMFVKDREIIESSTAWSNSTIINAAQTILKKTTWSSWFAGL